MDITINSLTMWLPDYWGKKDIVGILLMPPTRHAILHLHECGAFKYHIRKGKKRKSVFAPVVRRF